MSRTVKRASHETPSIQSLDRGLVILEAVAKSAGPILSPISPLCCTSIAAAFSAWLKRSSGEVI